MNKKTLLTALMTAFLGMSLTAQTIPNTDSPQVELTSGTRSIYPDRMGFAPNASVLDVLQSAPQLLLDRQNNLLPGWALAIDGVAYQQNPMVLLSQTRANEILKIMIIFDCSISNNTEGINGIINIVMKTPQEGLHGEADLMAGTDQSVSPSLFMSYKKNRWTVTGSLLGLRDKDETSTLSYPADKPKSLFNTKDEMTTKKWSEAAKVVVDYKAPKDRFQFRVMQQYAPYKEDDTNVKLTTQNLAEGLDEDYGTSHIMKDTKPSSWNFRLQYWHTFNQRYNMVAMVSEGISRTTKSNHTDYLGEIYDESNLLMETGKNKVKTYTTVALLKFIMKPIDHLTIQVGSSASFANTNTNYLYTSYPIVESDKPILNGFWKTKSQSMDYDSYHSKIHPFVEASFSIPHFTFTVGDLLMVDHYSVNQTGPNSPSKWKKNYLHDMVSSSVVWKPNNQNHVMVSFSNRVSTPTILQLYPYRTYTAIHSIFVGDEQLKTTTYQVYDVLYSYHAKKLSANLNLRYYDSNHMLYTVADQTVNVAGLNETFSHVENTAGAHTFNASASAQWNEDRFSLAGGIDFFHVKSHFENKADEHNDYFTIRFSPMVKLPYSINLSSTIIYYSKEKHLNYELDPYWWLSLRMAKQWKQFNFFGKWENIANKTVKTHYYYTNATNISEVKVDANVLSLGFSYLF